MTSRVPQRFVGLWQRRLLETPSFRDTSTEVFWLQTPTLYVDLRVPRGPAARCEGFAGRLAVEGDVLTWQRWLDLSPPSPWPDVGRMRGDGDLLEEFGVHHPYREVWQRVSHGGDGRALVWDGGTSGRGVWVMLGRHFMWALFRHEESSPSQEISYGLREERDDTWTILRSSDAALLGTTLADRYLMSVPQDASGDWLIHDRDTGRPMCWRLHA